MQILDTGDLKWAATILSTADIAANHDGDLERAKDLIYLCAEAGARRSQVSKL